MKKTSFILYKFIQIVIPLFLILDGCSDISTNKGYSSTYVDKNISSQSNILDDRGIGGTGTGTICGNLYEDKNKNSKQSIKEYGARGINISILDSEGRSYGLMTDEQGYFCIKSIPEGRTLVNILIDTLPKNMKLIQSTQKSRIIIVEKEISNNLDPIAYISKREIGSICGNVMVDGENYLGAEVQINRDKEKTITVYTNNKGVWCDKSIPVGTEVTIKIVESSLPKDIVQVIGKNNDKYIISTEGIRARIDGYEIQTNKR